MSARPLSAIVLAAGHGTRMRSTRPKPVHQLVGRPLVRHVLDALATCPITRVVVVVGHGAEEVTKKLQEAPGPWPVEFVEQRTQRGTGDAVGVGLTGLPDDDLEVADDSDVLVVPGDTPLLRPRTLSALVAEHRLSGAAATVLTARFDDPTGYGRVVRNKDNGVQGIVEDRDASEDEREIDEINTSIYVFRRSLLTPALRRITSDNAQGELYVTDVIEVLASAGHRVVAVEADDPGETHGVNDRAQLATAEAELRRRINDRWMRAGVTIVDPAATYIEADVELAPDVTVWPGSILQGTTVVGGGAEIGPGTLLVDARIGGGARVVHSTVRQAEVGEDAQVGPYASVEPGHRIPAGDRTGAFYSPDEA